MLKELMQKLAKNEMFMYTLDAVVTIVVLLLVFWPYEVQAISTTVG